VAGRVALPGSTRNVPVTPDQQAELGRRSDALDPDVATSSPSAPPLEPQRRSGP